MFFLYNILIEKLCSPPSCFLATCWHFSSKPRPPLSRYLLLFLYTFLAFRHQAFSNQFINSVESNATPSYFILIAKFTASSWVNCLNSRGNSGQVRKTIANGQRNLSRIKNHIGIMIIRSTFKTILIPLCNLSFFRQCFTYFLLKCPIIWSNIFFVYFFKILLFYNYKYGLLKFIKIHKNSVTSKNIARFKEKRNSNLSGYTGFGIPTSLLPDNWFITD